MKTLKELRELDRKIMEEDYIKSYRRPTLGVILVWWLFMVISLGVFGVFTYGLAGIFFQFLQK